MPIASVVAAHNDDGEFHLKGVVDSHSAAPLCSEKAALSAKVVSLERTLGGGIAYDVVIDIDDQSWKDKEAADAAAAAQAAANAKVKADADAAAKVKADADAAAAAADQKLAALVTAAVAKAVAPKA